jgi:hypothetical protein
MIDRTENYFGTVAWALCCLSPRKRYVEVSQIGEEKQPQNDLYISYSPDETARQLTLIAAELYGRIGPDEWKLQRDRTLTPNLNVFKEFSTQLSEWVAWDVATMCDCSELQSLVPHWVMIARVCTFPKNVPC